MSASTNAPSSGNTTVHPTFGAGKQLLPNSYGPDWDADRPELWVWKTADRNHSFAKVANTIDVPEMVVNAFGVDFSTNRAAEHAYFELSSHRRMNSLDYDIACHRVNIIGTKYGFGLSDSPAPVGLYKTLYDAGRLSKLPRKKQAMFEAYLNRMCGYDKTLPMEFFYKDPMHVDYEYYDDDEKHFIDCNEAEYMLKLTTWANANVFAETYYERKPYNPEMDPPPSRTLSEGFFNTYYKPCSLTFIRWLPDKFVQELRFVDRMYREIRTWCFIAKMMSFPLVVDNPDRFISVVTLSGEHLKALKARDAKRKRDDAENEVVSAD